MRELLGDGKMVRSQESNMAAHLNWLTGILMVATCVGSIILSPSGVHGKKHEEKADVSGNFSLRASAKQFCGTNRAMLLGGETTTYPNQEIFCLLDVEVKQCVQLLQKSQIEDLREFGCCRIMKNRCDSSINCMFHKHCKRTIKACVPAEIPTIPPCSPPQCIKPTCRPGRKKKPWCKDH